MNPRAFCLIIGLLLSLYERAQNLVPNPSFEDTVTCPTTLNQINRAKFWTNPTQGSPDYFNACNPGIYQLNVPYAGFGYQPAYAGSAYGGFYAFQKGIPNFREYIQTKLSDTLVAGRKYLISFFISLSNVSEYSVSNIGAYFSTTQISASNSVTLNYTPQIQNPSSTQLSDSTNWMLVQDTLLTNGTELYMTIGNFYSDSQTDTLFLGSFSGGNVAYYYIDDVSVIDVESLEVSEHSQKKRLNVYPNPSDGKLYINGLTAGDKISPIEVSDVTGRIISKYNIPITTGTLELNLNLNNGVYFVKFVTNGVSYEVQKVIISK
jgi:hypothetical protein